jgi:amino acid adenylation domain-containing protein
MRHESIVELFEKAVDRWGSNVAISVSGREVSYEEVEKRANRLANFLLEAGVSREALVGVMADDKVEAISSIIGILKAGCAYVPLDAGMPDKRLKEMIKQVRAEWHIIESKHAEKLSVVMDVESAKVVCLDEGETNRVRVLEGYRGYGEESRPRLCRGGDELCYVYFTSGSTGVPKGIAGRLKGIDHFIRWEVETLGIGEGDRVSQLLPVTFDGSLRDIFAALVVGGRVCVPRDRETILDGKMLMEWIEAEGISLVHCVPSLLRMMVNEQMKEEYFQRLRYILLAGEPLLPADVQKWMSVYGCRVQLVNLYGTSETTMAKFYYFIKEGDYDRRSIPIGKPMPGAKALLLDKKHKPCPPGVVGEIYIKTPYRSLGYYGQPELTSEVFIQDPLGTDPDEIVYRTGDLGRLLKDGNYEYVGRRDQQVKIRGVRVELFEVENALRAQAEVKDVAVVDREDGSGYKYLCAYLVLEEGGSAAEVRERLIQELPEYLMPSSIVPIKEMPRTISGKIDRKALARMEEEGRTEKKLVLPRTPVEEVVAGIWAELLRVEEISVEDNFFQVGGHSLMATRILTRVRNAFLVDLPLRVLFEFPTVTGLAEQIEIARWSKDPIQMQPLVRVSRDRGLPLSFAQQQLWFLDQLQPGNVAYNISDAVRLMGELDIPALAKALSEIVRRHEVLRTVFAIAGDSPVQIINPPGPIDLPIVDLSEWNREEVVNQARRLAAENAAAPFNLARDLMIRVTVLRLGENDHVVIFTTHHIASDGWSIGIFFKELTMLYETYIKGENSQLPELPIHYADFAVWQRKWLDGERLKCGLEYWRKQLEGAPALEIPTDRPRPKIQTARGSLQEFIFSQELTQGLKRLSQQEGVTLFITLLAAFKALLYRYSGQDDISVGIGIANRARVETEGIIGFFVNVLVLRTDLSREPTFKELLRREREVALEAYAHQDVPFALLVKELALERDLSYSPLSQINFVLHNTPVEQLKLPGLTLHSIGTRNDQAAKFDLTLSIGEGGGSIRGAFKYNTDLFDDSTIVEMRRQFETLLKYSVEDPDREIESIPLVTEEESWRLAESWSMEEVS